MAIAHDAQTRWPVTDGTSTATGDQTTTHTPAGEPKGATVVLLTSTATVPVTGVLYGGRQMIAAVAQSEATEAGRVDVYFLGDLADLSGPQIITFQGCTADAKWAMVSTVTAATARTAVNDTSVASSASGANPQASMSTTLPTISYGGVHSGAAAPVSTVLTGCTHQEDQDYGAKSAMAVRRTSQDAASGAIAIGYTLAADDYAVAAISVAELIEEYARPIRWAPWSPWATPAQQLGDATTPTEVVAEQQIGSGTAAAAATATETKVAIQGGVCSTGTATSGTATVAAAADPNQAWPLFAPQFLEPSAASFQMLGSSSTVSIPQAAQTGTGSGAAAGAATERKVAVQTGRSTVAGAGTANQAKRAASTGTSTAAPATGAIDAKKVAQTGISAAAPVGTHSGAAVRAQTGHCSVGLVVASAARKVGVELGRSSVAPAGTGSEAKRAATIGRCSTAPVGTHSGTNARAQSGHCGFGSAGQATGRKVAIHGGSVTTATVQRGTQTKRVSSLGRSCLAPVSTGLHVHRASQRGHAAVAVAVVAIGAGEPDLNPLRVTIIERSFAITYLEDTAVVFVEPTSSIVFQEGA